MNSAEANRLLAHCAAFDNRKPSTAAAQAWAAALHDVPFDADALAAVARYYGAEDAQSSGQRWIQPHHVRTHRRMIRAERLEQSDRMVPNADPDDPAAYMAAYRRQIKEIADGRIEPPAIEAGADVPDEDNPHVAAIIAEFDRQREAKQRRDAAEKARHREAAHAYLGAQELLLDLPDHGADAVKRATEELLGDAQAALGFPLLAAAVGTSDREKVIIHAARTAARQEQS